MKFVAVLQLPAPCRRPGARQGRQAVLRGLRRLAALFGDVGGDVAHAAVARVPAPAAGPVHGQRQPGHGLPATEQLPAAVRDLPAPADEGVVVT